MTSQVDSRLRPDFLEPFENLSLRSVHDSRRSLRDHPGENPTAVPSANMNYSSFNFCLIAALLVALDAASLDLKLI